jgi:CDP-diacylglycerol--glycerol-3-phosphate 3-phosphatidyltransferase
LGGAATPRVRSLDGAARTAPAQAAAPALTRSLPNALTLARLILAPVFALVFLVGSPPAHVASLVLYVVLALTDLYDGWLARRTGIVTSFGKFMDPLADKVLVSLALIVLLARDFPFVPAYLVLLIVGREFLVTGLRSLTGFRGVILVPTLLAKLKTVLQNLFVIAALATIVARDHRGQPAASGEANAWLLALLWCVTAVTLVSGALYLVGTREIVRRVSR